MDIESSIPHYAESSILKSYFSRTDQSPYQVAETFYNVVLFVQLCQAGEMTRLGEDFIVPEF